MGLKGKKSRNKKISYDFHGYDRETCISELEKIISDAFMKSIPEIEIIHGFGRGILKKTILDYLNQANLDIHIMGKDSSSPTLTLIFKP